MIAQSKVHISRETKRAADKIFRNSIHRHWRKRNSTVIHNISPNLSRNEQLIRQDAKKQ